ncbi:unnamed protein product [Urochloa decumbens]|uniref:VQ domain-containing protein n=1 Tax=Urochloa decumbens TaxID=240449 RepID=A0ABC9FLL5_9POAL
MSTAAPAPKAKRSSGSVVVGLHGPRPQPLSLPAAASPPPRPSKRPRVYGGGDDGAPPAPAGPVIVYEHTPRVIHARPDEFKALVQRLTGRPATETTIAPPEEEAAAAADPLVLTLGKKASAPPLHDDTLALPSPGGGGLAGFLLSPGNFLFSPATMQALHELISS